MIARLRGGFLLGLWFGSIALLGPIVITMARLTGNQNWIYGPVGFFIRFGLALVGVRVAVSGLEHLSPAETYLFTPNHQSLIDVPLLWTYLGRNVAYLAKKELLRNPVLRYGFPVIGVVPIDRSNTTAAVSGARQAAENLRHGKSYVVFPEGTRSTGGRLLPFKKGAFIMAMDAGVSIVPVTVSGGAAVMPKGSIRVYPATIQITVHDPVSVRGYSRGNLAELIERTRVQIQSAL
jgi:1-acyl-sn-glycerol-3-phosphate acyltransferase